MKTKPVTTSDARKIDFGTLIELESAVAQSCALHELFLLYTFQRSVTGGGEVPGRHDLLSAGLDELVHATTVRLLGAQNKVTDYAKRLKQSTPER